MEAALRRFLSGSGYGSGSGTGDGSGDGYDSGDGYGSGDGSGYGYEDGSGYGYGSSTGYGDEDGYGSGDDSGSRYDSGSGNGYGSGSGYGSGDDSGSGSGYGYGYKLTIFNRAQVHCIDTILCVVRRVHTNWAVVDVIDQIDYTATKGFIAKVGDYFAHGTTIKDAFRYALAKQQNNLSPRD